MPLYFVDVADDETYLQDEYGIELEDICEAREQAIALLPDLARQNLADGEQHEFMAVVRCAEGRVRYQAKLTFVGHWVEPPTPNETRHTLADRTPIRAKIPNPEPS